MYFNNERKTREDFSPKSLIAALILVIILVSVYGTLHGANAEDDLCMDIEEESAIVIVDEGGEAFPVITSIGKENIKAGGVKSKGTLIRYTIPETLLRSDPTFLKLMIEAEKYIGYPYVYGASKPSEGFDCAGFVCYVFRNSGVYKLKNRGANGLHDICTEISERDARPGDLVFFEKTMGKNVKGITHVGIYVGNGMMIHAGDPVGFADLRSGQWSSKIVCYGRLPIDK